MSDTFDESTPQFRDMALLPQVLSAITDMGYEVPTPIQSNAIEPLLDGHDVVGVAQTGTGKTAAFGLPLFSYLSDDAVPGAPQALIIAPTRELALQNSSAIESFAAHLPHVSVATVYGGSSYGPQIGALRDGAQIVVGTPGRIMDLMKKGKLHLESIRFFVLDEADEMLRMGFQEDVETISADIPDTAVRALFSATMPAAIQKVANKYLDDPIRIAVTPQASTVDNIEQTYAVVPYKFKTEALIRVLSATKAAATIVFVATRIDVEQVTHDLAAAGFKAGAISGDVNQAERERMVERLRNGAMNVLVATDVAARGLDVERVELVINYDVPRETDAYVHRIGRTGRAGRAGTSLTFFTPREAGRLRRIEELTKTKVREITIPSPDEVNSAKAASVVQQAIQRAQQGGMDVYLDALAQAAQQMRNAPADITDSGDNTCDIKCHLDDVDALQAHLSQSPSATDSAVETIAAGLIALMCRDNGPASLQRSHGRIRYEETVDDYGRFLSARFEQGRDKSRPHRANQRSKNRGFDDDSRPRKPRHGATLPRYRVDVGYRDGVKPGAILGAITGESHIQGNQVGHIEMMSSFSLVEIEGGLDPKSARRLLKTRIKGRNLNIREDTGPPSSDGRRGDRGFKGKKKSGFKGKKKRW
ncbi:MAG: DEAD/DEAH box helicase [Actinomycetaceae bacterium]|nr:DEAD/DEAH box helicase [Actinomycetaceae bacterium]